jgi:hypothetical protein
VTVPCCRRCNEAASKDDEHFRFVLSVRHETGAHPDARAVRDASVRSIGHPKKRGFTRAWLSTVRPVEMRTEEGAYAGETAMFTADSERLFRVVRRIVRGLFYHHQGAALGDDVKVAEWIDDAPKGVPASGLMALHEAIMARVRDQVPHAIGRDVLRYWMVHDAADARKSAWALVFYGAVRFLVMTVPRDTPASFATDVQ